MAENENTALIANKISADIFRAFHWELHAQNNTNFDCVLDSHTSDGGKEKLTHPGDVVFFYFDPYINKTVYLHTDLKSYAKSSIQARRIREALHSLAMTNECANVSESWGKKFLPADGHTFEVRGLLFVANHDNKATARFSQLFKGVSKKNIPLARNQLIHVLGPVEISGLYSIANDITLCVAKRQISPQYRFFYPDLTLWKRHTPDDQRTGATIEMLLAPYIILKHGAVLEEAGVQAQRPGSVVYYGRKGDTINEFVYLIDCLSRYQLVNSREQIRIRASHPERCPNIKNNFEKAKHRYCSTWGFDGDREQEILSISIDGIQHTTPNYVPDEIGWK